MQDSWREEIERHAQAVHDLNMRHGREAELHAGRLQQLHAQQTVPGAVARQGEHRRPEEAPPRPCIRCKIEPATFGSSCHEQLLSDASDRIARGMEADGKLLAERLVHVGWWQRMDGPHGPVDRYWPAGMPVPEGAVQLYAYGTTEEETSRLWQLMQPQTADSGAPALADQPEPAPEPAPAPVPERLFDEPDGQWQAPVPDGEAPLDVLQGLIQSGREPAGQSATMTAQSPDAAAGLLFYIAPNGTSRCYGDDHLVVTRETQTGAQRVCTFCRRTAPADQEPAARPAVELVQDGQGR